MTSLLLRIAVFARRSEAERRQRASLALRDMGDLYGDARGNQLDSLSRAWSTSLDAADAWAAFAAQCERLAAWWL